MIGDRTASSGARSEASAPVARINRSVGTVSPSLRATTPGEKPRTDCATVRTPAARAAACRAASARRGSIRQSSGVNRPGPRLAARPGMRARRAAADSRSACAPTAARSRAWRSISGASPGRSTQTAPERRNPMSPRRADHSGQSCRAARNRGKCALEPSSSTASKAGANRPAATPDALSPGAAGSASTTRAPASASSSAMDAPSAPAPATITRALLRPVMARHEASATPQVKPGTN